MFLGHRGGGLCDEEEENKASAVYRPMPTAYASCSTQQMQALMVNEGVLELRRMHTAVAVFVG